jgi:peptidoglycan/LPS O-acetylase OafA/YrhL
MTHAPYVDRSSGDTAHFLILRIALASAVLISHFPIITGTAPTLRLMSPTFAVQAFFAISGWVVSASFARSATSSGFWLRRAARLYPLYLCVIVTQAAAAWALARPSSEVTGELLRYLTVNCSFMNFLQPSLFGLLADAPVKAFNPSLWTLKLEVIFYVLTPLIVTFVRSQRALGTAALCVGSIVLYYLSLWHSDALARQFPGQFRFFAAGILCWQLSENLHAKPRAWHALAALGAFYIANRTVDIASLGGLQPLLVALFVYGAAYALPEPKRVPDVSYGIYIWHGPVIQFTLLLGLSLKLWIVCAATVLVAALSWYGVEKPAIHWARKLSLRVEKLRAADAVKLNS